MGHACEILTFREKDYTKKQIQAECDDWGSYNADAYERGYFNGGLGCNVRFTDKVFNSEAEAEEYLEGTFGNYSEMAVRYKVPKRQVAPVDRTKYFNSKALLDLKRRVSEYEERLRALAQPHYANVTVQTIKCKTCGAVLPTKYCGTAYENNCPFCKSDLRPATVREKEAKYVTTYYELKEKYKVLESEAQAKYEKACAVERKKAMQGGYDMYWAVACEVHC